MEQAADLQILTGLEYFAWQFHMNLAEFPGTVFIENAGEIDYRLTAAEQLAQRRWVVYIGLYQLDIRQDHEIAMALTPPGGYPDPVACRYQ